MRIWLKPLTDDEIEQLTGTEEAKGLLFRVEIFSEGGADYVELTTNPWQPSFRDLGIPQKYIERVTARAKIISGLRPDGIYERQGARLMAQRTLEKNGHRPLRDENGNVVFSQFLDISASSVDEIKDIFFAFRDGSLSPVKNWSGDSASFTEAQTINPSQ